MKKIYEDLELEIIRFETEDVITSSQDEHENEIDPIQLGGN